MRESIFFASIRSFFIAFSGIVGLILGFALIIILIASMITQTSGDPEITYTYSTEVAPNASGVRKVLSSDAPVILKINIKGIIGAESLTRKSIDALLVESRERDLKDGRVKAIILDIDSPGGTVTDAFGIYRSLKDYKEAYKVPIYAHVNGLCASGGMYIACAADEIYASEDSLVGSVGVLSPSFLNFYQLLEKIGVQSLTLTAGKGKDEMNPLRPWKPGEEDNYKAIIAYYYNQFVDTVVANRPRLDKTKLIDEYGAHVFPAKISEEYGYIDGTGQDYNAVLKMLAAKIGIEDDYYQVIMLENKTWLSELFKSKFAMYNGVVKHRLDLGSDLDPQLLNQYLYLYRPY